MQNNHYLENLEEKAQKREERKRKKKEMKISGKSVFDLQKIMKHEQTRKKKNEYDTN